LESRRKDEIEDMSSDLEQRKQDIKGRRKERLEAKKADLDKEKDAIAKQR